MIRALFLSFSLTLVYSRQLLYILLRLTPTAFFSFSLFYLFIDLVDVFFIIVRAAAGGGAEEVVVVVSLILSVRPATPKLDPPPLFNMVGYCYVYWIYIIDKT
jgi:hypothetical protein